MNMMMVDRYTSEINNHDDDYEDDDEDDVEDNDNEPVHGAQARGRGHWRRGAGHRNEGAVGVGEEDVSDAEDEATLQPRCGLLMWPTLMGISTAARIDWDIIVSVAGIRLEAWKKFDRLKGRKEGGRNEYVYIGGWTLALP
jgi:hypothetical protein